MEVALARRAVPEVRQRDNVVLPDLRRPRRSDRLRDLRSDGTRCRHVFVVECAVLFRDLPYLLLGLSVPLGFVEMPIVRTPPTERRPRPRTTTPLHSAHPY